MRNLGKQLIVVALVAGALFAVFRWPRLNDIETGRTPDYPDIQPPAYVARGSAIFDAAKVAVTRLPGWRLGGSGSGPAGWTLQATHQTYRLPMKQEIMITIRRKGGQTVVSVRSRSTWGKWDFGQNARNIRAFLRALDEALLI